MNTFGSAVSVESTNTPQRVPHAANTAISAAGRLSGALAGTRTRTGGRDDAVARDEGHLDAPIADDAREDRVVQTRLLWSAAVHVEPELEDPVSRSSVRCSGRSIRYARESDEISGNHSGCRDGHAHPGAEREAAHHHHELVTE
jgi:hypothetical protein